MPYVEKYIAWESVDSIAVEIARIILSSYYFPIWRKVWFNDKKGSKSRTFAVTP